MIEYIINSFDQQFPEIAGYTLVAFVVAIVVWKAAKFYMATTKIHTEFPRIQSILTDIKTGFTTLNQVLLEKQVISKSCFSNENSPRVINDIGIKLYEQSGAGKVYKDIEPSLMTELETKKFESLLELEQSCLEVLLQKRNDQKFKDIQNFAFEHPTFEGKPLTYTDILFILSLRLRDDFRKKHPDSDLG